MRLVLAALLAPALAVGNRQGRGAAPPDDPGRRPFTRIIEVPDPDFAAAKPSAARSTGGSALDRTIIKRLLNDQLQPHAYSCYARSLGRMVAVAGTATFEIEMGRGEVTRVTVGGFDNNAELAACLADAAYGIAPPLPTPGFNTDDRTIVTYALTFTMRNHQPQVAAATDATVAPQVAPSAGGARPQLDVDPRHRSAACVRVRNEVFSCTCTCT